MKEIKYRWDRKKDEYLTECEYINSSVDYIYVGDYICKRCHHFKGNDKQKKKIKCSYEDDMGINVIKVDNKPNDCGNCNMKYDSAILDEDVCFITGAKCNDKNKVCPIKTIFNEKGLNELRGNNADKL